MTGVRQGVRGIALSLALIVGSGSTAAVGPGSTVVLGPRSAFAQEPGSAVEREAAIWNPEYDLTLQVDTASRALRVSGIWRLPAAPEDRDSLEFLLWSRMRDLEVEVREPAGLGTVALAGEGDGDRRWVLSAATPFPRGREVVLSLSYRSDSLPSPQFKVSPGGSFAGGAGELWYPQTAFGKLDTGRLRFLVPPGHRVVSTGRRVAEAEQEAASTFTFESRSPVKFAFAAGPYRVLEQAAGAYTLKLMTLEEYASGEALLSRLAAGLTVLGDAFGPLPVPSLSIVEVDFDGPVSGTSEYGFIMADRARVRRGIDLPYWLHEMGHQWWGVLLKTRSGTPGRMLMSEGLAQFGMHLALEEIEGPAVARRLRMGGYGGGDDSPREYVQLAAAGLDLPLTISPSTGRETVLIHQLVNTRGFLALDMLARRVGMDRFLAVARSALARAPDGPTSWEELRRALGERDDPNLARFLQAWFDRPGVPDVTLEWEPHGSEIRGRVLQELAGGLPPPADVEIEARGGGRSARRILAIDGPETPFAWEPGFSPTSVVLDPDYRTLRWTPEWRAEANALAGVTRADFERRFGDRPEAIGLLTQVLAELRGDDPHGVRFRAELGLGLASESEEDLEGARRHIAAALAAYVRPAHLLPGAYLALARVADRLEDVDTLRSAANGAIAADRALAVGTGAAFEATKLLERHTLRSVRPTPP